MRSKIRVLPSHYDILSVKADVHVCPVNCRPGVMGKGLALTFSQEFQGLRARHAELCSRGDIKPGKPYLVHRLHRGRWNEGDERPPDFDHADDPYRVLLFPTKNHWGNPSEIRWIWQGLGEFINILSSWDIVGRCHIVFPALGCGLGGLSFGDVMPIFKAWAGCLSDQFDISVIEPR